MKEVSGVPYEITRIIVLCQLTLEQWSIWDNETIRKKEKGAEVHRMQPAIHRPVSKYVYYIDMITYPIYLSCMQ